MVGPHGGGRPAGEGVSSRGTTVPKATWGRPNVRVDGVLGTPGAEALGSPAGGVWASLVCTWALGGQLASVAGPQWMAVWYFRGRLFALG